MSMQLWAAAQLRAFSTASHNVLAIFTNYIQHFYEKYTIPIQFVHVSCNLCKKQHNDAFPIIIFPTGMPKKEG